MSTAEACSRKAIILNSGNDEYENQLADTLVKERKYGEAETIYLALLAHTPTSAAASTTSGPDRRSMLLSDLSRVMRATHRESEADRCMAESEAAEKESYKNRRERAK